MEVAVYIFKNQTTSMFLSLVDTPSIMWIQFIRSGFTPENINLNNVMEVWPGLPLLR